MKGHEMKTENFNYLELAKQKMNGLTYDELLELQTETGLELSTLENMYYSAI